jgi:hypothetical protein
MPLYDILEFGELLDSADMDVGDWVTIAQMIEQNYFVYDGFLVITGTDTMVRVRRKSEREREGAREERAPQESCARALRAFICFYHVVLLLLLLLLALVIRTHSFFFIFFSGMVVVVVAAAQMVHILSFFLATGLHCVRAQLHA